jgi:hypothetical protein
MAPLPLASRCPYFHEKPNLNTSCVDTCTLQVTIMPGVLPTNNIPTLHNCAKLLVIHEQSAGFAQACNDTVEMSRELREFVDISDTFALYDERLR